MNKILCLLFILTTPHARNIPAVVGGTPPNTAPSLQVSGLVKGAAYHVRVSSYNGVSLSYGKTVPSTPAVIHPADMPEPPSRVEVEAASPTSLAISWSPPNDAMGLDVVGYQVVRKRA